MSPIILLGLVVMWAVVLIPMWLRRHDETEESRSVERFTSAMHTLSRREPADRRYVVMPHRAHSLDVHVSGASAGDRRGRMSAALARRAARRARRGRLTAADRRRRTLLVLLFATGVTLLAAFVVGGMAVWALQFVADAFLAGFVAHLVLRARGGATVRSAHRPGSAAARANPRRRPAPRPAARPARTASPAQAARARQAGPRPERVAQTAAEVDAGYQRPMVTKRPLRAPARPAREVAEQAAPARRVRDDAMPSRESVRERAARIAPERVREQAASAGRRPIAAPRPEHEVPFDQTMPDYADAPEFVAPPAAPVASVASGEVVFDQTVVAEEHPTIELDRYAEPVFDQTAAADVSRSPAETVSDGLFIDLDAADARAADAHDAAEPEPEPGIGGEPWDPVPVPPPTYVNKPTAPPRRTRPPMFEPLLPPAETPEELDPTDDLEEILDRRWAVNN